MLNLTARFDKKNIDLYSPKIKDFDFVLFNLADGDISKADYINSLNYEFAYKWFYVRKVKELNELRQMLSMAES